MWEIFTRLFLRRYSLQRIKIILLSTFLFSLLFDFSFEIDLKDFKDINFKFIQGNAIDNTQFFALVFIFGVLILVDLLDHRRNQKIKEKYLDILRDKDVSDSIKMELLKKLPKE